MNSQHHGSRAPILDSSKFRLKRRTPEFSWESALENLKNVVAMSSLTFNWGFLNSFTFIGRSCLVTLGIGLFLFVCSCGATEPGSIFPELSLPDDESPHDVLTEWWYFNMHVGEGVEASAAIHFVIFQIHEKESSRTLYVGQVGITDLGSGKYVSAERIRSTATLLSADPGSFDLSIGDWLMSGENGEYRLKAGASEAEFNLWLRASGPPLLHGDVGVVDTGEAGITYYYSRPRLAVSGFMLDRNGERIPVRGIGWMDKQWGDFQPVAISWDWADLQLDDGTDVMVTRLMDLNGRLLASHGTIRKRNDEPVTLGPDDFTLRPRTGGWISPETGALYETVWDIEIPAQGVGVVAVADNVRAEYISRALGVVYWEAPVKVLSHDGTAIGQGFIELTGRARGNQFGGNGP